MSENHLPDLAVELNGGRLEGISVPDLLWGLCQDRRTGVLRVNQEGVVKSIYIENGRIIFAGSGHPDDRLGEMLLLQGLISLDQLERAVSRLDSGKRLGTLLIEVAAITPHDLIQGVLAQVKKIILNLFSLEEGEYWFEERPLPTEEVITLTMRTAEILFQGIRQVRSFSRIRRSVGPLRTCFRLTRGWEKSVEGLDLNEGEQALLRHLDDGGQTLEQLCREVFLSNFEIYQALWAFKVLGAIEEAERAVSKGEVVREGRLGREGIGPVLVQLCKEEETGVLYLSHSALDRAFHFREGRCVFATSSNIDDGLMAHLLRRGVISLQDREETARRLLSNKRVGTILLDMGVINESDLGEMVREQLSEILLDTFMWDRGEYAFVAGELPTFEDITLDMSVEDMVLAGVQRVTSWSRVNAGCASDKTGFMLAPDYLSILDRMSVGQEEWEVVSALGSPRTLQDLCRRANLADFRICQVLWALRLIGAVTAVDVDDVQRDHDAHKAFASTEERAGSVPVEPVEFPPQTEPLVTQRAEAAGDGGEIPPLDSPLDATRYIPRDEVEASLEGEEPKPEFEIIEDQEIDSPAVEPEPPGLQVEFGGGSEATGPSGTEEEKEEEEAPEPAAPQRLERTMRMSREDLEAALGIEEPRSESDGPAERVGEEATLELDTPSARKAEPVLPTLIDPAATAESVEATPDWEASDPATVSGHESAEEDWHPPVDLEPVIARFNAMQRILYRSIRSEVGAGAANFVRSCGDCLADPMDDLFSDVDLQPDGAWDPGELRRALVQRRVVEPWDGFQKVLDEEMERLRIHIGDARASSLRERLSSLEETDAPHTARPPE